MSRSLRTVHATYAPAPPRGWSFQPLQQHQSQDPGGAAPPPAAPPAPTPPPAPPAAPQGPAGGGPAGGPAAVLADLASERDRRQAAEAELARLRSAQSAEQQQAAAATAAADLQAAQAREAAATTAAATATANWVRSEAQRVAQSLGVPEDRTGAFLRVVDLTQVRLDPATNTPDAAAIRAAVDAGLTAVPEFRPSAFGPRRAPVTPGAPPGATPPPAPDLQQATSDLLAQMQASVGITPAPAPAAAPLP